MNARRSSLLRRSLRASSALFIVFPIVLAGGVLSGACSGEDVTSGKRVVLRTEVRAVGVDAPFTNAHGWTISLTRAAVSLGPLYYFDGSPIFTAHLEQKRPLERLWQWAGVRTAHAHPGHYVAGNTQGQMLDPASVDLLAGPAALPDGDGVSGVFRSARFMFASPATGPTAGVLGAHVVLVEGQATKEAMTRVFAASADLADVLDSYGEPKVEGCLFHEADVQADGTVTLAIDPRVWLDQIELDDVKESQDGSPVPLVAGETPYKSFTRGLKKGSAYVFSYSP